MKFTVYNDAQADKEICLKLFVIPSPIGTMVELKAVDKTTGAVVGGGNILRINSDGSLHRHGGVTKTLGFKLDSYGKIVVNN